MPISIEERCHVAHNLEEEKKDMSYYNADLYNKLYVFIDTQMSNGLF